MRIQESCGWSAYCLMVSIIEEQEQTNQDLQQQVQQPQVKFNVASDQFGRSGRQLQGCGGGKNK